MSINIITVWLPKSIELHMGASTLDNNCDRATRQAERQREREGESRNEGVLWSIMKKKWRKKRTTERRYPNTVQQVGVDPWIQPSSRSVLLWEHSLSAGVRALCSRLPCHKYINYYSVTIKVSICLSFGERTPLCSPRSSKTFTKTYLLGFEAGDLFLRACANRQDVKKCRRKEREKKQCGGKRYRNAALIFINSTRRAITSFSNRLAAALSSIFFTSPS